MNIIIKFWSKAGILNYILLPLSYLYLLFTKAYYFLRKPYKSAAKIICVGNLTMGGGGKTPSVIMIARKLSSRKKICCLSKGYNRKSNVKFIKVDSNFHTAAQVGDEPLIISQYIDCFVCKSRKEAIKRLEKLGYEIIILDDGMQTNDVVKDVNIMVLKTEFNLGNKMIFPAGPLRNSLKWAEKKVDCIIRIGNNNDPIDNVAILNKKTFAAGYEIELDYSKEQKYIAFCGIALPDIFFNDLRKMGVNLVATHSFADHHNFSELEINNLLSEAKAKNAMLICTEKDIVKINSQFKQQIKVAKLILNMNDFDYVESLIN